MSDSARSPEHRPDSRGERLLDRTFVVSADCHVNEPADLWAQRIEPRFRERIPRVEVDAQGQKWSIAEGLRPVRRTMGTLSDEERRQILGGNAARLYGIAVR